MARTRLELRIEFTKLVRNLEVFKIEFVKAVERGTRNTINKRVIPVIRKNIEIVGAIASGALYNSIGIVDKVTRDGKLFYSVGSKLPYAIKVEEGQSPTNVPISNLVKWANVKFKLTADKAEIVALRVQAAIAARGTKGKHFLARSLKELEGTLQSDIQAEVQQSLKRLL